MLVIVYCTPPKYDACNSEKFWNVGDMIGWSFISDFDKLTTHYLFNIKVAIIKRKIDVKGESRSKLSLNLYLMKYFQFIVSNLILSFLLQFSSIQQHNKIIRNHYSLKRFCCYPYSYFIQLHALFRTLHPKIFLTVTFS